MVLVSTRMSDVGEEQFSGRFFKGGMTDLAYSPELRQAVAAGPASIKVSARDECFRFGVQHSSVRV